MRKSFLSLCLSLTAAILLTTPALAYGPVGHHLVGATADQLLVNTPTGAAVSALLDGMTLEKAAVVPDEIKGWDKKGADDPNIFHYSSRPRLDEQLRAFWRANQPTYDHASPMPSHHWFHYTDVPIFEDEKYADGKTGRSQWDIVHMMNYCIGVLRGTVPEDNERKITKTIAVVLLAHYVGDIHQPLHVGAEYFDTAGHPMNPDRGKPGLEDQGGNTIMLQLPMSEILARRKGLKLHGFWDTDAVVANLPPLLEGTDKEARRTQNDAAEAALVKEFITQEPKNWRLPPTVPVTSYPEAWANEILPIARQAHERLQFMDVHPAMQSDQPMVQGNAGQKPTPDGVPYRDWAARVVRQELRLAGWRLADLLTKSMAVPATPAVIPVPVPKLAVPAAPSPAAAAPLKPVGTR